jgi:hypothetical protein
MKKIFTAAGQGEFSDLIVLSRLGLARKLLIPADIPIFKVSLNQLFKGGYYESDL